MKYLPRISIDPAHLDMSAVDRAVIRINSGEATVIEVAKELGAANNCPDNSVRWFAAIYFVTLRRLIEAIKQPRCGTPKAYPVVDMEWSSDAGVTWNLARSMKCSYPHITMREAAENNTLFSWRVRVPASPIVIDRVIRAPMGKPQTWIKKNTPAEASTIT